MTRLLSILSRFSKVSSKVLVVVTLFILAFQPAWADSRDDEIQQLRDEIRALDQKLKVLERKQEIKDEDAATTAKSNVKVSASDKGFSLTSADGATGLKIRGLVQADSRWFFNDGGITTNDTFILRRARVILEGNFAKYFQFQIVPELAGSTPSLLDANVTVALSDALQFKAGKFKAPIGLELLQSDSWVFFTERSLATNLVPNRDVGAVVTGDLFGNRVNYTVGVLNGVPDGATSTNADFDDRKDYAGRLFFKPFTSDAGSVFQGLGFGVAGNLGQQYTASGLTAGYKTDGQQTFFKYNSGVIQDGSAWRVSPQLYWTYGPAAVIGEYVLSTVNVRPSANARKIELQNKAWQVGAGYVLTGEDESFNGVVPAQPFSLDQEAWGAFELVARYSQLDIDSAAFPTVASGASNAKGLQSWGLGVNWYPVRSVRVSLDYLHGHFNNVVATPSAVLLRQDEQLLSTRLQVSF